MLKNFTLLMDRTVSVRDVTRQVSQENQEKVSKKKLVIKVRKSQEKRLQSQ